MTSLSSTQHSHLNSRRSDCKNVLSAAVPAGEGSKVHAVKSDEEYEKELKEAMESPTGTVLPPDPHPLARC